jgi:hypothetical protein
MWQWIISNIWTIVVLAVIAAVVTLVIVKMVKDKKRGKTSCNCGCSGCPYQKSCDKDKK